MLALVALGAANSHAQLINVDFQKGSSPVHSGAAATGSAGDFWNSTDTELNVFLTDLTNAAGGATTVDLTWSDELQSSENSGVIEFGSSGHNDLMEDYAFTGPGSTATVTISDLPLNVEYTLYLYGVPDGGTQQSTFVVNGANEGPQDVTEGNVNDDNGLATPDDYVLFTGTTGGSGQIVFTQTGTGSGSGFSGSNGFQLDLGSENTDPPAAPELVSPADTASSVPVFASLKWDAGAGADSYGVYLWQTSGTALTPSDPPSATVSGLTYDTEELRPLTSYSWFVKSINSFGEAASATRTFTTGETPVSPFDTLINVDFQKNLVPVHSGAAVVGSPGDVWNSTDAEANIFLTGLTDSAGNITTANLSWSDELQSSENSAAIEFGSFFNALMEDYAFTAPSTTATITISGLETNLDYTLYLYGVPDSEAQEATFEVIDANEAAQTVTAGNIADGTDLISPDDYVVFTGNTGASGQIVYTQTGGDNFSGSNGFQLGLGGGSSSEFDITRINYDPVGETVQLTWNSRSDVTYIAKFSQTMADGWGSVMGGQIGASDDEITDDGDFITVTFDLTAFDLEDVPDLFFRIEEE